jgi:hypothetical protein
MAEWEFFGARYRSVLQLPAVDFGFGEQNGVSMQLLLTIFGRFAADMFGFSVLLRFEPNFLFALVGSELHEIVQALVESALVRGLVANIESELFGRHMWACFG